MAARNTARKRAFQILFEGDQRGADVLTVLADWIRLSRDDTRQPPVSEYTMQLVEGYAGHTKRIDELIAQYAVGWTLDRMPVVDRNLLRLGAYELIWVDETPDAVVLDEMVQLAKEFSTDESPAFVCPRGAGGAGRRGRGPRRACRAHAAEPHINTAPAPLRSAEKPPGWPEPSSSSHPGGTFLLSRCAGQASSWVATARRASASRTPQLISCSVRTEGDWS